MNLPKAARELVDLAESHGWQTLVQWQEDSGGAPFATVQVGRKLNDRECWHYRLTWHSRDTGTLRYQRGVCRTPDRMAWHDAPSLTKIRETITHHPG